MTHTLLKAVREKLGYEDPFENWMTNSPLSQSFTAGLAWLGFFSKNPKQKKKDLTPNMMKK